MALSVAAYAKHRGVSRQSVYKAIKSGRIPVGSNGLIDANAADIAWQANTDPGKGGVIESLPKVTTPVVRKGPVSEPEPVEKPSVAEPPIVANVSAAQITTPTPRFPGSSVGGTSVSGTGVSGGGIPFDYQRLRSQKLATEIAKGQLALKEAQGELVKRSDIKSALFARARQDRDMVLNFSSRYGASIAAELDADPRLVMAALDKHLRALLKEMSEQDLSLNVTDAG